MLNTNTASDTVMEVLAPQNHDDTSAIAPLRVPADTDFFRQDLAIPESTTRERWDELGVFISSLTKCAPYWLARWIQFGRRKWGSGAVQHAIAQLEFSFVDVRRAEAISMIPAESRRPALSVEHHYIAARADMTQEQRADSAKMRCYLAAANHLYLAAADHREIEEEGIDGEMDDTEVASRRSERREITRVTGHPSDQPDAEARSHLVDGKSDSD